jgi:hypothetical protein
MFFYFDLREGGCNPAGPFPRERACYQKNYLSLAYTLKLATHAEFWCLYTLLSTTTGTDFDQVVFSRFNLKIRIFGEPVIPNKQEKLRKKFAVMFTIFLYTIFTQPHEIIHEESPTILKFM